MMTALNLWTDEYSKNTFLMQIFLNCRKKINRKTNNILKFYLIYIDRINF